MFLVLILISFACNSEVLFVLSFLVLVIMSYDSDGMKPNVSSKRHVRKVRY